VKQDAGFNSWRQQHFCRVRLLRQGSLVCRRTRRLHGAVCKIRRRLLGGLGRVLVCSGGVGMGEARAEPDCHLVFVQRSARSARQGGIFGTVLSQVQCLVLSLGPVVAAVLVGCCKNLQHFDPVRLPCVLRVGPGIYSNREESFQF
jgi:hypothetical protein